MELRERCESRDVVDPRSRFAMWEVIESYVAEGTTVLLCTHYLEEADRLAERAVVNPLSYTVDAARGFALGNPSVGALAKSVLIAAALATVSIIGATATYRRIDH